MSDYEPWSRDMLDQVPVKAQAAPVSADRIVADGVWYVDAKSGDRRWMTTDQLMAFIRSSIDVRVKRQQASLESFAKELGELHAAQNEEIARWPSWPRSRRHCRRCVPLQARRHEAAVKHGRRTASGRRIRMAGRSLAGRQTRRGRGQRRRAQADHRSDFGRVLSAGSRRREAGVAAVI